MKRMMNNPIGHEKKVVYHVLYPGGKMMMMMMMKKRTVTDQIDPLLFILIQATLTLLYSTLS